MQPRDNLARYINWTDAADILGLPPGTSRALPALLPCPICRTQTLPLELAARSLILQHSTLGGQWHYCSGCGHQGDLLSLLSRLWGLKLRATISKCDQLGLFKTKTVTKADIDNYIAGRRFENRLTKVWNQSRGPEIYSSQCRKVAWQLGWKLSPTVAWREIGAEQLLGCLATEQIEAILQIDSTRASGRKNGCIFNTGNGKIFTGAHWTKAVVLPFFDLPGRLAGLMFYGRQLRIDKDILFCTADPDKKYSVKEGGLHLHPSLLEVSDSLIAFSSLKHYMRLQLRQLDVSAEPLPMVGWQCNAGAVTTNAWQMLSAKRLIFCEPRVNSQTFQMAVAQDGYIHEMPTETSGEAAANAWLKEYYAADVVQIIQDTAVPWPEFLDKLCQRNKRSFDNLLEPLLTDETLLLAIRQYCDSDTKQAVKTLRRKVRPYRTVWFNNRQIEQRKDGLYLLASKPELHKPSAEQISDAVLKLDRLITYPLHGDADYEGRIQTKDGIIEFVAAQDDLQNNTGRCLDRLRVAAGNTPGWYHPAWHKKLYEVAQLFNRPESVVGFEKLGWDNTQSAFIFPEWLIHYGGKVVRHNKFRRTSATPANLSPSRGRLSSLQTLLTDTPVNSAFWSAYLELLGLVLRPVFDGAGFTILCTGPVNDLVAAVCTALDIRLPDDSLVTHNWPTFETAANQWITGTVPNNVITVTSWPVALGLKIAQETDSQRIKICTRTNNFDAPMALDYSTITWVIFEYLKHACETKFEGLSLDTYREHFAAFVTKTTGSELPKCTGWQEYGSAGTYAELLARVVGYLITDGYAQVFPKTSEHGKSVIWFEEDNLYIPKILIRTCLAQLGFKNPAIDYLSRQLLIEKQIKGEELVNGYMCWCVSAAWLFRFVKQERNKELGRAALRLAK